MRTGDSKETRDEESGKEITEAEMVGNERQSVNHQWGLCSTLKDFSDNLLALELILLNICAPA